MIIERRRDEMTIERNLGFANLRDQETGSLPEFHSAKIITFGRGELHSPAHAFEPGLILNTNYLILLFLTYLLTPYIITNVIILITTTM